MITFFCPAKVNLFLAIHGKDTSGYHRIDTILARYEGLHDVIEIEPSNALAFTCTNLSGHINLNDLISEKNLVMKALRLLEKHTGKTFTYKIRLQKNIPPRSGLGGGSSDAAGLLLYLNEVEHLRLSREQLMVLGTQLGNDVPFFISGYTVAHATHYGEKIVPLPTLPTSLQITVELTGHEISTKEAYHRWDFSVKRMAKRSFSAKSAPADSPSVQPLIIALQNQDPEALITAVHNDFELITSECGPYNKTRHLCGSGGAVYHVS